MIIIITIYIGLHVSLDQHSPASAGQYVIIYCESLLGNVRKICACSLIQNQETVMLEQPYGPIIFIGRKKELALIEQLLDQPEKKEWILNIHGDGGIGKTRMLQRACEIVKDRQTKERNILVTENPIDLCLTANQVEIGILKNLADQLSAERFKPFYEVLMQHHDMLKALDMPFHEALAQGHDTSEALDMPFHEMLAQYDENMPDALGILKRKFLEIYKEISADHIVLLFDTTEAASAAATRFFSEMLLQMKMVNDKTFVIAAGRVALTNCPPHSAKRISLNGLSAVEVNKYCESQDVTPSQAVVNRLAELSRGRPVLVALMLDWINFISNTPEELAEYQPDEFERALVERVGELRFEEDQIILAMAHFNRRFDANILAYIFEKTVEQAETLIRSLSRFSFVKYRPADNRVATCLLHDEMRDLIVKHLWPSMSFDPLGMFRADWSRKIIAYYTRQIEDEENKLNHGNPIEKQNLERECLYYRLSVDLQAGFKYWGELFSQAKTADLREAVNIELEKFEEKLPPELRHKLQFSQATILYSRGRYSDSIRLMEKVLNDSHCGLSLQAVIRAELIPAYTNSGDTLQAIDLGEQDKEWFKDSLENLSSDDPDHSAVQLQFGHMHNNLGYAYRKKGDIGQTITHYEEALKCYESLTGRTVDKVKAATKTNLGYALHLSGRDREARAQCKGTLKIKQRLGDPYELGLTYNVLGIIEANSLCTREAEDYFEKALSAFKEAGNERGKALVYTAYGRMLRQQGGKYTAETSVRHNENTGEHRRNAGEMLGEAVAILKKGDKSSLAEALNENGALLREQGKWPEAVDCFIESKKEAEKVHDDYIIADNLQDLGITYGLWQQWELAVSYSEQAVDAAKKCQSTHLSGRAQRTIANAMLAKGQYDEAFAMAIDSTVKILDEDTDKPALTPARKELFYKNWEEWIVAMLDSLPSPLLKKHYSDYLIRRWHEVWLPRQHAGFVIAVRNVMEAWQETDNVT